MSYNVPMAVHQIIKRCIIGAYASFMGMTAICFLLYPEILDNYTYGISYFGSVPLTMIPYYLGFSGTIICLGVIAWQLLRFWPKVLPLVTAFWLGTAFMIGVAATSYSTSDSVFLVHLVICIGLTLNELIIAAWVITRRDTEMFDIFLALVLVITVLVSALPVVHNMAILRSFPLRELIVFSSALALTGRAALRVATPKIKQV